MENKEKYLTSDLKLQAFLRTILPNSFVGINKNTANKVNFIFYKDKKLDEHVRGYFEGEKYLLSPQSFANYIDIGKDMIFGNV